MLQVREGEALARQEMLRNHLGMLQAEEGESLALEGCSESLGGERLAPRVLLQVQG